VRGPDLSSESLQTLTAQNSVLGIGKVIHPHRRVAVERAERHTVAENAGVVTKDLGIHRLGVVLHLGRARVRRPRGRHCRLGRKLRSVRPQRDEWAAVGTFQRPDRSEGLVRDSGS
jgi:hypothetical protein